MLYLVPWILLWSTSIRSTNDLVCLVITLQLDLWFDYWIHFCFWIHSETALLRHYSIFERTCQFTKLDLIKKLSRKKRLWRDDGRCKNIWRGVGVGGCNEVSTHHDMNYGQVSKEVCNRRVACSLLKLDGSWQATPSITKFLISEVSHSGS